MQDSKRMISPLWYFILISSLTNLAFLIVGFVLLALYGVRLSSLGIQVIVFLLLWKGALVGFVSWFSHKQANNKDFLVKFIGVYLGRFFGVLIGGFLGYEIFDTLNQSTAIGSLVGASAFYFAGRWIGARVSIFVADQLDKVFSIPESQVAGKIRDIKSSNRFVSAGFILYGFILPFLLVIIGLLMGYFDIPLGYFPELLSIARIVVLVLSIFSVFSPWLLKNRWLNKYQTMTSSPESIVYWLGLVFSIVPIIYGFVLFIAVGASLLELCVYAVASCTAAIIWNINNRVSVKQKAG